jgi:hypothetical protein
MMGTRPIVISLFVVAVTGCAPTDSHETVQQHIMAHARQIEAEEYAKARMIAVGDLDGDGIEDTAVVYTLEGARHSNNYEQYLAFSSSRHGGRFVDILAGGKDIREIDGVHISAGRVELLLREYTSSDASCCPSRPATTSYVLKDRAMVETRLR